MIAVLGYQWHNYSDFEISKQILILRCGTRSSRARKSDIIYTGKGQLESTWCVARLESEGESTETTDRAISLSNSLLR